MILRTARLLVVGFAATTLGFGGNLPAWSMNAFAFLLTFAAVGSVALSVSDWRRAQVIGELVTGLAVLQGVSPVLFPTPTGAPLVSDSDWQNTISWRLAFEDEREALRKRIPLPDNWAGTDLYVRIDLGRRYTGEAGFDVEVNGVRAGRVSYANQAPWEVGLEDVQWFIRVPPSAIERLDTAPAVVLLRPSGIDPRLTIAGHDDPYADPFGPGGSEFFDGRTWSAGHLAGSTHPTVGGTYRIFLDPQPRKA